MILQEKMTGRRAFCFAGATLAFTYIVWGILAFNPGGLLPYDSPQGMFFFLLGDFSPPMVLFALVKKWGKTKEERAYFKTIFKTVRGWKRAIIVTALFCAVYLSFVMIVAERIEPWYMLAAYFPMMVVGGGLEEIGWRGFFQPALEKKLPFWLAAPVVGAIWAAWHIPLWFIPGTVQANSDFSFFTYAVFCVLLSYIFGSLKRITGSTAACIALHAWVNVIFSAFAFTPTLEGKSTLLFFGLLTGFAVAATVMVLLQKEKNITL